MLTGHDCDNHFHGALPKERMYSMLYFDPGLSMPLIVCLYFTGCEGRGCRADD